MSEEGRKFSGNSVAAASFFGKRCFCVWAAIGLRAQKNSGKGKEICQVFSFPLFRRCEFDTGDIFGLTTNMSARKNCNCGKHEGKYVQQSRCF